MSISFNNVQKTENFFIKTYGPKSPLLKYYFRSFLDFIGIQQPIEYYHSAKRLSFEAEVIELWRKFNLNAPKLIKRNKKSLFLSHISGRTISEIFQQKIDFKIVKCLFDDLNLRHQLAFKFQEPRLCHVDSNLRNILYADREIFHVDFEMGRIYEDTNRWAMREITKLLISLTDNLAHEKRVKLLRIFCNVYQEKQIIELIIKSKKNKRKNNSKEKYTLSNLVFDLSEVLNEN